MQVYAYVLSLAKLPAESVAIDLENFSRHARRSTVQTEDVVLLARKNPDLLDLVKEFVEQKKADKLKKGKGKERR